MQEGILFLSKHAKAYQSRGGDEEMYRTSGASVRVCLEEDDMIHLEFNATSESEIIPNGTKQTSSTF